MFSQYFPAAGTVKVPVQVAGVPAGKPFPAAVVKSTCASTRVEPFDVRASPGLPSCDSADAGTGLPVRSSATA